MQLISVYLYPNKVTAYTNHLASWKTERYRQVYNRNLKLYRGTDNRVDIQIRNSDEKPYDISDFDEIVFSLLNKESRILLLSKVCTVQSAASGKVYVYVSESEISSIEPGFYYFSVVGQIRENGIVTERTPLYIDTQYGAFSVVEIKENVFGESVESTIVDEFRFFRTNYASDEIYYISSIINAKPELSNDQTVHTFQYYFTNYSGVITLQGSQSDGGNPNVWIDLRTDTITARSTPLYRTIIGQYNWFRVVHYPAPEILDSTVPGTVDSILYR